MITYQEKNGVFHLQGRTYSYFIGVQDGVLTHLYWGARVPDGDVTGLTWKSREGASFDTPVNRHWAELPTQERGYFGLRALDIANAEGDDVLLLRYEGHRIFKGKAPLAGLPSAYTESEDEAETLEIDLRDALTGALVTLSYTVYRDFDVLARSMRVRNEGGKPFEIKGLQAAAVRLPKAEYDVMNLKGAWAREREVMRTGMPQGTFAIESRRGASGHENNPFLAVLSRSANETAGEVYAATWVYSGSFRAAVDVNVDGAPMLSIGFSPDVFRWRLEAGETFQSPEALLVYSPSGLNGMSERFHRFIRLRICRGAWRDRERPILINNWEATYFGFTEEKLLAIARRGAEIGCELFVLDDGWFGKRDSDNCSLGDWVVNPEKMPGGMGAFARQINDLGMRFGLWFEPEMISPDSDLYRAHPEWCLHVDGRDRTEARQQLILDYCRPEVQDYIIEAVSSVLRSAHIEYVKWDMNRNMTEGFSETLPPQRRMESQHRYMLGLYRVLEAVTEAFPEVLFESCSGGGGRFDCGMLCYMPQTWTSDDTDAYERIRIQYGTSMVYPCSAMGAHVSAVPNHQTGRVTPFKTRCEVALGGNFGFELDLSRISQEDMATAREAVARVKRLRGVLQRGSYSRLVSPFENRNFAAWQYVSEDGARAVLCMYQPHVEPNGRPFSVRMTALEPETFYRRVDTGEVWSGAALMNMGVPVEFPRYDFASSVLEFERV